MPFLPPNQQRQSTEGLAITTQPETTAQLKRTKTQALLMTEA